MASTYYLDIFHLDIDTPEARRLVEQASRYTDNQINALKNEVDQIYANLQAAPPPVSSKVLVQCGEIHGIPMYYKTGGQLYFRGGTTWMRLVGNTLVPTSGQPPCETPGEAATRVIKERCFGIADAYKDLQSGKEGAQNRILGHLTKILPALRVVNLDCASVVGSSQSGAYPAPQPTPPPSYTPPQQTCPTGTVGNWPNCVPVQTQPPSYTPPTTPPYPSVPLYPVTSYQSSSSASGIAPLLLIGGLALLGLLFLAMNN